jgi:catechol 2,3-dioxygenase
MSTVATPTLHHVNLKTTRLREMIEWYGLAVGLEPVHVAEDGSAAWLTNDAANHRLALLAVPGLKDDADKIARTGLHHIAFEYRSMDELLDTYARLKAAGVLPHACLDHGMTMSLYYVDPDGNSLELQADEFGDWSKSKEFMLHAPEFTADPIGTSVDPDRLLAARAAGGSADDLHRRAYAGEFAPDGPLDLRLPVAEGAST